MDDVEAKNPQNSQAHDPIEKPFQVLKNQMLHERAVKDLTQSDFFQIEIDRLLQENDAKIENADKVLKKQHQGLNKKLETNEIRQHLEKQQKFSKSAKNRDSIQKRSKHGLVADQKKIQGKNGESNLKPNQIREVEHKK